ncbi:unnamed protein product [Phytomonas sp. EM1]|nr:unnamed protein product [Phytomonas sp. EM1]|eukprot:CCW61632.1 unnamed protein product [Phytomonas sp. isolate EM1]
MIFLNGLASFCFPQPTQRWDRGLFAILLDVATLSLAFSFSADIHLKWLRLRTSPRRVVFPQRCGGLRESARSSDLFIFPLHLLTFGTIGKVFSVSGERRN